MPPANRPLPNSDLEHLEVMPAPRSGAALSWHITLRRFPTCRSESTCTATQTDQTIKARIDDSKTSGGMCPHSARSRQITTVYAGRAPEGREAEGVIVMRRLNWPCHTRSHQTTGLRDTLSGQGNSAMISRPCSLRVSDYAPILRWRRSAFPDHSDTEGLDLRLTKGLANGIYNDAHFLLDLPR